MSPEYFGSSLQDFLLSQTHLFSNVWLQVHSSRGVDAGGHNRDMGDRGRKDRRYPSCHSRSLRSDLQSPGITADESRL